MDAIFPTGIKQVQPIEAQLGELYRVIRQEKLAKEDVWRPYNVRFDHDQLWRDRVFSITCARECNSPVWLIVRILFAAAAAAPFGWALRPV